MHFPELFWRRVIFVWLDSRCNVEFDVAIKILTCNFLCTLFKSGRAPAFVLFLLFGMIFCKAPPQLLSSLFSTFETPDALKVQSPSVANIVGRPEANAKAKANAKSISCADQATFGPDPKPSSELKPA